LVFLLKRKNISLGKHVFQDATDIRSLKHDSEAKYSGYYKHSGYKLDVTLDADHTTMEITSDEGQNLVLSQKYIADLGMLEQERVVDDKYASFPNIARSEINRISLFYKIAKHWVPTSKSDLKKLKRLYQRYHREDDFLVNPSLDFMLQYLYKKEEYETVGGFFRNQRMNESKEKPKDYKKKCNMRGARMEGFFGRVKNTTLLDDRPCKRGWKGLLFQVGMSMLTLVFAALIRVQNGITSHLTNVTYIT